MTEPTLSPRALNRALLARQLLLEPAAIDVAAAVTHLVGLQAQAPQAPYVGLWTRVARFEPDAVDAGLLDRSLVRTSAVRGTIHLVTVDDAVWLRPLVQPLHERTFEGHHAAGLADAGVDRRAALEAAAALMAAEPLTAGQLGELLAERWPAARPASLARLARFFLPLVQVPPRGLWGRSGASAHTTLEAWTGRTLDPDPSPEALVLRYLAAFGPATVADVQTWAGVTRLAPVVAGLADRLRPFRDERGRRLVDLPDAPRPDPGVEAPVRFVAEYDNLLLSHQDRTRIIADDHRRHLASPNGQMPGSVLVDGFARARWKVTRAPGSATLTVDAYVPLGPADRSAVEAEGSRLLGFVAAGDDHDVRVTTLT